MITLPCSFALSRTPPPPPSPTPKKEIKDGKWLYIHHCSKKTCTEFPKSLKFYQHTTETALHFSILKKIKY